MGALPNGEPVIGAYYYLFRGAPYIHAGWTPELEYNNYDNTSDIYALLKAATDCGVNCIAFSCDLQPELVQGRNPEQVRASENSLEALRRTYEQNLKLFAAGKKLFISPFFHAAPNQNAGEQPAPNTTESKGQWAKIISSFGKEPSFLLLIDEHAAGGQPAPYAADWQSALHNAAQSAAAKLAGLHAIRFQTGVKGSPKGERETADEKRACLDGRQVRRRAFDRLINQPFVTAKIASEIAKYSGRAFFYEVSPSFADSQRRDGVRIESDPFLYPYAWTYALSTLPDGVMISSLNDWLDGSAIDASKEYGKKHYETTERYSSVFKSVFPSLCAEKHRKKAVAVIFANSLNESALYPPPEGDKAQADALGIIKGLECLSMSFDVIPEKFLAEEELAGRRLVFAPSGCNPSTNHMLYDWVSKQGGKALVVSASKSSARADRWWLDKLGLKIGDEPVDIKSYPFAQASLTDRSENLNIIDWPECEALAKGDNGVPKVLRRKFKLGPRLSQIILINGRLGNEFYESFYEAAANGKVPNEMCDAMAALVDFSLGEDASFLRRATPPSSSFEIKRGPVLRAQNTLITSAVNVIPWAYIVEHRRIETSNLAKVGGSGAEIQKIINGGHYTESTKLWYRESVKFNVPIPADEIVSEVCVIDGDHVAEAFDPDRFQDISFTIFDPNEVRRGVEGARRLKKPLYKSVEFSHSLKFYALFAIPLSPVKFEIGELTIHRGQTKTIECSLTNLSRSPIGKGIIRLKSSVSSSGLTMDEATFALGTEAPANPPVVGGAGERAARLALTFRAGPDCATGNRTAVFEIEAPPGKKALFWRSIKCERGPILKCRTTRIGGLAGQVTQVEVVLANVGGQEIKEADLKLIGTPGLSAYLESAEPKATMADLAPGHSRTATFKISVPRLQRLKSKTPPNVFYETTDIKLSVEYKVFGEKRKKEFPLKLISILPIARIRRPKWLSRSALPIYIVNPYQFKGAHPLPIIVSRRMLPSEEVNEDVSTILEADGTPVASQTRGKEITFFAPILNEMSVFYLQGQKGRDDRGKEGANSSTDLTVSDLSGKEARAIYVENDRLALKWDGRRSGALVSFKSKDTGIDYLEFSDSDQVTPQSPEQGRTVKARATNTDRSKQKSSPVDSEDDRIGNERSRFGSFTIEYTKANGETVISSETSSNVKSELTVFERGGNRVVVLSSYTNDDVEVKDFWTVYSRSRFVRLLREIKPKKDMTLKEFVPLNARFIARPFDMMLPNGVGFSRDDGAKGGYIETWHIAESYFAYSGDHLKADNAAGIIILKAGLSAHSSDDKELMALQTNPKDVVRKVRYGFFRPGRERGGSEITERDGVNELRIRLRGKTQLKERDTIILEIMAFAGSDLSYEYIQEQAILEKSPPLILIGDDARAIGGLQTPVLMTDQ